MTTNKLLFLLIVCVALSCKPITILGADESKDYEYTSSTTYIIKEDSDSTYSLTSKNKFTFVYLSKKSTEDSDFNIHQGSFDKVMDIEAEYNGESLPSKQITFQYAADEDVFISDYIIHTISLPGKPNVGDRVTYEYERKFHSIEFLPTIRVSNYESIKSEEVIFEHPQNMEISLEKFLPFGDMPYTFVRESPTRSVFRVSNLKERKSIPYFPFNSLHAVFLPNITVKGKALVPITAKDFSKWYLKYFTFPTSVPSTAKSIAIRNGVNSASTIKDKVKVLYDYVRKNIRYIAEEDSLGSIIPRKPADVLERGFGDCKDKAFLITSLAKEMNLPVKMVLISTTHSPVFGKYFHRGSFNHAICVAEVDGQRIFLDPTCKECEFGNLPDNDMGHNALIVDADNPEFIPVVPEVEQKPSFELTITSSIDDLKNGTADITIRNDYMWYVMNKKENATESQFKSYMAWITTNDFQKIVLDSFLLKSQDYTSMTFTAKADLSNYVISSTEKKYIPQNPFVMPDNSMPERESDSLPIYMLNRNHIVVTMNIDLKGMQSKPSSISHKVGNSNIISSSFSVSNNGVAVMKCEMKKNGLYYEDEKRKEIIEFYKNFLASKKLMNILTKQ